MFDETTSRRPDRAAFWNNPRCGFRMMWWDPIAIAICVAAVWAAWDVLGHWALIAPFVLCNFFLFCNVFRFRSKTELVWAATFLANSFAWLAISPNLPAILLVQSGVTVSLIAFELSNPDYRGIFWRRVHPNRSK